VVDAGAVDVAGAVVAVVDDATPGLTLAAASSAVDLQPATIAASTITKSR
jgi:hypothetical protein